MGGPREPRRGGAVHARQRRQVVVRALGRREACWLGISPLVRSFATRALRSRGVRRAHTRAPSTRQPASKLLSFPSHPPSSQNTRQPASDAAPPREEGASLLYTPPTSPAMGCLCARLVCLVASRLGRRPLFYPLLPLDPIHTRSFFFLPLPSSEIGFNALLKK